MAIIHTVKVYGINPNWKPPTPKQSHKTEWLEWELPKKVHKSATKFIKEELKRFFNECKCDNCKKNRKKK